jgi:Co/Zn/Cd efflux system component
LTLERLQGFQWRDQEETTMSATCSCHSGCTSAPADPRFRKALWVALVLNALMFLVELGASWASGSVSLMADSVDFFGDAANYAKAVYNLQAGVTPEPITMGAVGLAALAVNAGVALMLFRFRSGDANMRSVWICSRNDAIGNVAVMLAAVGVFGTGSAWPDLAVAGVMGALAIAGASTVLSHARRELREPAVHAR